MKLTMYLTVTVLIALLLLIADFSFPAIAGILLVVYVIYHLITIRENALPIGHIVLLISGLQWLLSPIMAYQTNNSQYAMAVTEDEYLWKTLALYMPFYVSILYFSSKVKFQLSKDALIEFCTEHRRDIKIIIIIGFLASIFPIRNPSLSFVLALLEGLFYVGAIMLSFSYPQRVVTITICFIGYLLLRSIIGGMFHDLMIWGLFSLFLIFYLKEYSVRKRILLVFCLLICANSLQAIKSIYRDYTWWGGYQGNKIELFANLFVKSVTGELNTDNNVNLNTRLNQGWIISRIYNRIPQNQPFVAGRTIIEGIEATLIPRFLFPNKKGAGKESIKDFETFTGYKLNSSTSMGLSILGEAYGNFGLFGGALFMFLWGYLIVRFKTLVLYLNEKQGYWYFFLPLLCFDLIKAEINFVSVLNWTVKSFVFVFIIIHCFNYYHSNKLC